MKLLNKEKNDISDDLYISLGIMLECVWAAEIIAYRIAETMDSIKAKGTLVQEKKQCLNKARRMNQDMIRNLEIAFDDTFNMCGAGRNEGGLFMDEIQECANDIVKLLLIYYARGDGDWERKDKMKAALLNFKPVKDVDLSGLLKYFNLQ